MDATTRQRVVEPTNGEYTIMKVGITFDERRGTVYALGKYNFYTREVPVDDAVAKQLSVVADLAEASQRILSSLYNSYGKFVLPEDLEKLSCLVAELQTPEAKSAKPPKQKASGLDSSQPLQRSFVKTE